MAEDIRFYDFEFNLLRILPSYAVDTGYISINVQQDFNDSGALEISFVDNTLTKLVEQYKDTILVVWRGFQGFITSYKWTDKKCLVTGMHLNGLLHRSVIPTLAATTATVESVARAAITSNIPWLTLGEGEGFTNPVDYETDKHMTADTFIQDLLALDNAGYAIRADFANKKFVFELIKPQQNNLMLSVSNLNAYDIELTYINKSLAYGGWYEDEASGKWTHITTDSTKTDIYNIDTVLSAKTATEAKTELKKRIAEYEVTVKTRNVQYGTDYVIGDILRLQTDGMTVRRLVSGVSMWQEKSYGEEPIFSEVNE